MLKNEDVILIDGMNLYHRAYSVFIDFHNSMGIMTGGIYGFVKYLLTYKNLFDSNNIIVCWDSKTNKRKELDKNYKKDRRSDWDEQRIKTFFGALRILKSLLNYSGVIQIERKGLEADDMIWMMTKCFKRNIIIVTNDKDMLQLVNDNRNVRVYRPTGDKGFVDRDDVFDKYKIYPNYLAYYLAIVGDRSDNVSGVYNHGKVRAVKILNDVDSADRKYFKSVFDTKQYKAFIKSYKLVKLGYKMNIDFKYKMKLDINYEEVNQLLYELEIKSFKALDLKQLSNRKFKRKLKVHYESSRENF